MPDDPMRDPARNPAERLVACLQLLLAQVGTGEPARRHWRAQHDAYVASPPSDDAVHAFLALERLSVHFVEKWLVRLRDEGALAPGELEHHARFLLTVVNGRLTERAMPGDLTRLEFEARTLVTAASAVLQPAPCSRTDSAIS